MKTGIYTFSASIEFQAVRFDLIAGVGFEVNCSDAKCILFLTQLFVFVKPKAIDYNFLYIKTECRSLSGDYYFFEQLPAMTESLRGWRKMDRAEWEVNKGNVYES